SFRMIPPNYRVSTAYFIKSRGRRKRTRRFTRWKARIQPHHFCPCGVVQTTCLPLMQETTGAKPVRDANFSALKAFLAMHFFGMEASSVQLRVGAPVWWQCGSTAVEPPLRQVSYVRRAQGSTGDCDHFRPPCSSLWISFVKKSCRGSTGGRLQLKYFSG